MYKQVGNKNYNGYITILKSMQFLHKCFEMRIMKNGKRLYCKSNKHTNLIL